MKLIERVRNTIFKCNLEAVVDYHAGGFFVKKEVSYLIFLHDDQGIFYTRNEGSHPKDYDYENLLVEAQKDKKSIAFKVYQPKMEVNLIELSGEGIEIKCMPSNFIENVKTHELNEILVDNRSNNRVNIFDSVFCFKSV